MTNSGQAKAIGNGEEEAIQALDEILADQGNGKFAFNTHHLSATLPHSGSGDGEELTITESIDLGEPVSKYVLAIIAGARGVGKGTITDLIDATFPLKYTTSGDPRFGKEAHRIAEIPATTMREYWLTQSLAFLYKSWGHHYGIPAADFYDTLLRGNTVFNTVEIGIISQQIEHLSTVAHVLPILIESSDEDIEERLARSERNGGRGWTDQKKIQRAIRGKQPLQRHRHNYACIFSNPNPESINPADIEYTTKNVARQIDLAMRFITYIARLEDAEMLRVDGGNGKIPVTISEYLMNVTPKRRSNQCADPFYSTLHNYFVEHVFHNLYGLSVELMESATSRNSNERGFALDKPTLYSLMPTSLRGIDSTNDLHLSRLLPTKIDMREDGVIEVYNNNLRLHHQRYVGDMLDMFTDILLGSMPGFLTEDDVAIDERKGTYAISLTDPIEELTTPYAIKFNFLLE